MEHICGQCQKEFKAQQAYLAHTCKETGFKPDTFEHLDKTSDGRFSLQSEKALARGQAKK